MAGSLPDPTGESGSPSPFLLHQLLSRAAAAHPGHQAVRCAGRSLTYGELDAASNALARALIEAGVRPGDRVGIHLPKRVEMVTAVYAALKAGAAYVPLDPQAPVRRVAVVAADCSIRALVATPGRAAAVVEAVEAEGHRPDVAVLVDGGTGDRTGDRSDDGSHNGRVAPELSIPSIGYGEAIAVESSPPDVPAIDTDLAYILYTSGSTGTPKGVMLTHRNALTFVEWCAARIGVGTRDRLSNHAPLHFDLSVFDLYLSALGGATLVLVPEEEAYLSSSLARLVKEERITVWYSVPSALTLMMRSVEEPGRFPELRAVVFAGEVFPTKHLRELRRLVPDAELWNLYGPTETNVCTYYRVSELPQDDRAIPIGRGCENTEVFALREDGRRAGVGEEGDLHVRGSTVMKGYWGQPEKTAEVLVPNPLTPDLPDLVYRTGDLVRLRPDGDYDFLGRRDHQIKSRGYRIELGDIEAALHAHPSVVEAVAVAVPHEEWGTAVVARLVLQGGHTLTANEVKKHLAGRIPRYMIPPRIEFAAGLPRTSTGKIDRRRVEEEVAPAGELGRRGQPAEPAH